jgi:hypothetical protein
MAEVYITSQELIKTLNISDNKLMEIQEFFDSIPDDEWELNQGKDYRVVNQSSGLREYTSSGAYTLARYLEVSEKRNFWRTVTEWFTHRREKIRKSFVKKKILDNCSSLIKRNDQFFISRADVVAIFGTRSDYLSKMADHTQRSQYPLIKGQDYEDFLDAGGLHFSLSGITKLSRAFEERQTKRNRKEECRDVGEVVQSQVNDIVEQILNRENRIQAAMKKIKTRDHQTCQISRRKKNAVNKLKLAAHHLYSRNEYPFLADVENNLITLTDEVHDQFHQEFMGGCHRSCTIDDLISFVHSYYPDNGKVITWLEAQKQILGNPQPKNERKPHVLYLPASKVQ